MQTLRVKMWVKICIINLLIVASFGLIMRYKIAFEFPFFEQKNLLLAHSHFALFGWISLILMVLMVNNLENKISNKLAHQFKSILIFSLVCAYGMLITFFTQGYGHFSIFFSSVSISISFIFGWLYYKAIKQDSNETGKKWFIAALLFNIFSAAGVFYLSYMMSTKNVDQHMYLASVYWYLHFQYNGWFLFSCIGLFINYLHSRNIFLPSEKTIFWAFALSCIPAYGLSVLWLDIPVWIYMIIVIATIVQLYGCIKIFLELIGKGILSKLNLKPLAKLLLATSTMAFAVKILLQTGSTIPAINNLAFGFRPIVIAYLHLVLLGIYTLFIMGFTLTKDLLQVTKIGKIGILSFLVGVVINEVLLSVQGICSFAYILIPFINEMLFITAFILFSSVLMIILSQLRIRNNN